ELHKALRTGQAETISFDRNGSQRLPRPSIEAYKAFCGHIFVARTNALFDGYRVRAFGARRISFAHLVSDGQEVYPEDRKRILFGCAALSFVVAVIPWTLFPFMK